MEDKRIALRKKFMSMEPINPIKKCSDFLISLRKTKKQSIFKENRRLAMLVRAQQEMKTPENELTCSDVFENIQIIMSDPLWIYRVKSDLSKLSRLFLMRDENEVLELTSQIQFAEMLLKILDSCTEKIDQFCNDVSILENTDVSVSIYEIISQIESKKIEKFIEYTPGLPKTLIQLLSKILQILPEIKNKDQIDYYANLMIMITDILSNFVENFGDEFENNLSNVDIYNEILACANLQLDTEAFQAITWFFETIIQQIHIPINISECMFEIYAVILEKASQEEFCFNDQMIEVLINSFSGIHTLTVNSEAAFCEFIGNEILLDLIIRILNTVQASEKSNDQVLLNGAKIIAKLSEYDYNEKYLKKGVYAILYKIMFTSQNSNILAECMNALTNFCVLSPHIRINIVQKDAIIAIIQKSIGLTSFGLKHETVLFLEMFLDTHSEDEKFLELMFKDLDIMNSVIDMICDSLDNENEDQKLKAIMINYLGRLLEAEQTYYKNHGKYEKNVNYSNVLSEKDVIEKLENIDTSNHSLRQLALKIRFTLDLIKPDSSTEDSFTNPKENDIFQTNLEF